MEPTSGSSGTPAGPRSPAVRRRRALLGAVACLVVSALFLGLAVTQDRGAALRVLWVVVGLVWAGLAVRTAAGLRGGSAAERPPAAGHPPAAGGERPPGV